MYQMRLQQEDILSLISVANKEYVPSLKNLEMTYSDLHEIRTSSCSKDPLFIQYRASTEMGERELHRDHPRKFTQFSFPAVGAVGNKARS